MPNNVRDYLDFDLGFGRNPITNDINKRINANAIKQSVSAIRLMVEKSWKMVDEAVNQHFLGGDLDPEKCRLLAEAEAALSRGDSAECTRCIGAAKALLEE